MSWRDSQSGSSDWRGGGSNSGVNGGVGGGGGGNGGGNGGGGNSGWGGGWGGGFGSGVRRDTNFTRNQVGPGARQYIKGGMTTGGTWHGNTAFGRPGGNVAGYATTNNPGRNAVYHDPRLPDGSRPAPPTSRPGVNMPTPASAPPPGAPLQAPDVPYMPGYAGVGSWFSTPDLQPGQNFFNSWSGGYRPNNPPQPISGPWPGNNIDMGLGQNPTFGGYVIGPDNQYVPGTAVGSEHYTPGNYRPPGNKMYYDRVPQGPGVNSQVVQNKMRDGPKGRPFGGFSGFRPPRTYR